ncbi:hypothetical protein HDU67_009818, partial [Dinochytrium kinnereticum]
MPYDPAVLQSLPQPLRSSFPAHLTHRTAIDLSTLSLVTSCFEASSKKVTPPTSLPELVRVAEHLCRIGSGSGWNGSFEHAVMRVVGDEDSGGGGDGIPNRCQSDFLRNSLSSSPSTAFLHPPSRPGISSPTLVVSSPSSPPFNCNPSTPFPTRETSSTVSSSTVTAEPPPSSPTRFSPPSMTAPSLSNVRAAPHLAPSLQTLTPSSACIVASLVAGGVQQPDRALGLSVREGSLRGLRDLRGGWLVSGRGFGEVVGEAFAGNGEVVGGLGQHSEAFGTNVESLLRGVSGSEVLGDAVGEE